MLENPKGSPFQFFSALRFFSENKNFSHLQFFDVLRQNPLNCDKNVDNFGSVPLSARHSVHFFEYVIFRKIFFVKFSIFEYCKREYLTLGSLFAIFEPWIWRRLGPVAACYFYRTVNLTQFMIKSVTALFVQL